MFVSPNTSNEYQTDVFIAGLHERIDFPHVHTHIQMCFTNLFCVSLLINPSMFELQAGYLDKGSSKASMLSITFHLLI